jgi:hypothetical protein
MCHMAATPLGRSCLAAAGCLPRWLSRAPSLAPKQLQLLVMVLVSCQADWTAVEYFALLLRGHMWVHDRLGTQGWTSEAYKDTCPPHLKQQVSEQHQHHGQLTGSISSISGW